MISRVLLAFFLTFPTMAWSFNLEGYWVLKKSEISYQVTHPLHVVFGKSTAARGKGSVSYKGIGTFLVAVPVKTFRSGDANRDLHMLEVTRAGTYPMVVVNVKIPHAGLTVLPEVLEADITVNFAGKEKTYPQVGLNLLECGSKTARLTGVIPVSLKDFGIHPPSLLAMPIRDEVPVRLDMVWQRLKSR